jgi:putative transposase
MEKEYLDKIALFRFSLIAPLVNNTYEASSKMQYFRNIAAKKHTLPDGTKVRISASTVKKWYLRYKNHGIDSLIPKIRSDAGKPRVLDLNAINKIHDIKEQFPYITGVMVYQKLVESGYVKANDVSLSSVHRYLRDNNLKRNQVSPDEKRAFEMEFANDCWQADTSFCPCIMVNGRKVKTYLISIIDDASRLVVHAEFFFRDNAINLQKTFKKAIAKYGIPRKFYVDNGGPYKNGQLSMICASLGIVLIHTRPYTPTSKGKIERVFRTLKDGYINAVDWNSFKSLEHLNSEFSKHLNDKYTNETHSSIKYTPKDRYLKDLDKIKYIPETELEKCFLHRVTRKVRNDATIPLNNQLFEVPQKYIGQRINIRYSPINLDEAYIFDINNKLIDTIFPLRKVDNSKIKRKNIDYSIMIGDGSNV